MQKYFFAWAKVIMPSAEKVGGRIAYIDLYSGPGRYKDGAASTPLMVLERAIADPKMANMLVSLFNDEDRDATETLANEVSKIPGILTLKFPPKIISSSVGADIQRALAVYSGVPSFTFFDPFGYKGLSSGIIQAALREWGCDCVFFFNYNRINAAINNGLVEEHMAALFGPARTAKLRAALDGRRPHQREAIILEELAATLREIGGRYVLPFRFRNSADTRTSHFLVFVSKHERGYGIMKEIMAGESTEADQGVPSFSYFDADQSTPLLFSLARPFEALVEELPRAFGGRRLAMNDVFREHNVDTPYIKRNYKAALLALEASRKITCEPAKRRKETIGDNVIVTFPRSHG